MRVMVPDCVCLYMHSLTSARRQLQAQQLLRRDGPITLFDPVLQQGHRDPVCRGELRRYPATAPETIPRGARKRQIESDEAGRRQLHRETKALRVVGHEYKYFPAHLDRAMAPRELLVRLRKLERVRTKCRLGGLGLCSAHLRLIDRLVAPRTSPGT